MFNTGNPQETPQALTGLPPGLLVGWRLITNKYAGLNFQQNSYDMSGMIQIIRNSQYGFRVLLLVNSSNNNFWGKGKQTNREQIKFCWNLF